MCAIVMALFAVRLIAMPASEHAMVPTDAVELRQNYPNPFTGSTEIGYKIPSPGHVLIRVFNTIGQDLLAIVNEDKPAGDYIARFEGGNYPSGQYTYTLVYTRNDDGSTTKLTRKMFLVR